MGHHVRGLADREQAKRTFRHWRAREGVVDKWTGIDRRQRGADDLVEL